MLDRNTCGNEEICRRQYQREDWYRPCKWPWQTVLAPSFFSDSFGCADDDKQGHQNAANSPGCELFDGKLNARGNDQDSEHIAAGRKQEMKQAVFLGNAELTLGPTSQNEDHAAKASERNGDFCNGVKKVLMHVRST